ncbi:MAG: sulfide/dihydroorotate dehydrogenase-like FAD/NAD-binding protein [Candidatus Bathyarchaeota archaeon]|nr:MAG: sulfide/dihydroorotate dehydrogenase-like FAD/NAD-binding protein [Candidatus Bathyarchaeota archaeon]
MHKIIATKELAPKIKLFQVHAPNIAAKAKPGQFIILILDEKGERIPLTIAGFDDKKGTLSFAFNEVGKTTKQLGCYKEGDNISSIVGPLGNPSEIRKFGHVLCVGGGVMIAPLCLQIRALREAGNKITAVLGARKEDLLIFEQEVKRISNEFYVATDDGSKGFEGLDFLKTLVRTKKFQRVVVMGPVVTMKAVSEITKQYNIPTIVTLTPIMVDGMGMCGVCRVTVANETRFACIDGPEFEGHQVDFEELVNRQRMFLPEERTSSLLWEHLEGACHEKA